MCPEIYKLDDQGFAYTDGQPISAALLARAREGADACPECAIAIVETEP
ncbi:MAG: ferredoxin [Candidatus Binatia bacterium]